MPRRNSKRRLSAGAASGSPAPARLDADVERLSRWAVRAKLAHELGETSRNERLAGLGQLCGSPPTDVGDQLCGQVDLRRGLVRRHLDEPHPLALAVNAAAPGECVLSRPDLGPELEVVEAELLGQLSPECRLDVFTLVDTATGGRPPHLAVLVAELDEQGLVILVEDECPDGGAVDGLEPGPELGEPAEPVGIRDGSVGRRGGGKDEEPDVIERALLRAELGTLTERAAVCLLADERDRSRPQLERQPTEALA